MVNLDHSVIHECLPPLLVSFAQLCVTQQKLDLLQRLGWLLTTNKGIYLNHYAASTINNGGGNMCLVSTINLVFKTFTHFLN